MLFRVRGCISSTRHTIVIFLALTATTLAQQAAPAAGGASDLAQLYAQGMSEFQAGDYAKAAADLDAAGDDPRDVRAVPDDAIEDRVEPADAPVLAFDPAEFHRPRL